MRKARDSRRLGEQAGRVETEEWDGTMLGPSGKTFPASQEDGISIEIED